MWRSSYKLETEDKTWCMYISDQSSWPQKNSFGQKRCFSSSWRDGKRKTQGGMKREQVHMIQF